MSEEEYKRELKKYEDKYNGASLPIFCEFNNEFNYLLSKEIIKSKKSKKYELIPYDNFIDVVGDIIYNSLYYPFNTMINTTDKNDQKKSYYGHSHAHCFEEVVLQVYHYPNYFSIDQEDYKYYSEQQLGFLFQFQKFLKLVKKPDVKYINEENEFAFNELARKYRKYKRLVYKDDQIMEKILNGTRLYFICPKTDYYRNTINNKYLICDKNYNYVAIAKIVDEKEYEVSKITSDVIDYKVENFNSLDELKSGLLNEFNSYLGFDGKIIIKYIEILERFNIDK